MINLSLRRILILATILVFLIIIVINNHAEIFSLFYSPKLTPEILEKSLQEKSIYYINNQTEEGNFVYEYHILTNQPLMHRDNQVRQAGALWGAALLYNYNRNPELRKVVEKGIHCFSNLVKENDKGKYVVYDETELGSTGTQALFILTCLEYLNTLPEKDTSKLIYERQLREYLNFLLSLKQENHHFHEKYHPIGGQPAGDYNPYYDGESLLAVCKSAKYFRDDSLRRIALQCAEVFYDCYVAEALEEDPDSRLTKGFYQWGTMSFYEIFSAGWDTAYGNRIIEMGHWMIDGHKVLFRTKNTAYAFEGLATAWKTAQLLDDKPAMKKFGFAIDKGLSKLLSWQVRGPMENKYLENMVHISEQAYGGVLNFRNDSIIRIDVVQHQGHALILARKYIYR